ncbi:MAG: hypothetical protein H7Z16_08370 [Pyrinomonadaceae bacterium]|nr:hypothetical protein [Pyrinomonadaceae bacterium]
MSFPKTCLNLVRRYETPNVLLSVLILMHLASLSIRAQGRITALEKNLRKADPTTEVTCSRQGQRNNRLPVTVSMALNMGDELISESGTVTVKARCGTATDLVLSGPFRVRFLRPNNKGCKIYSYPKAGGSVNVSSSVPTNMQSGEIKLGTQHTIYEVKTQLVTRTKLPRASSKMLEQQLIAYDGKVSARLPRSSKPVIVEEGKKIVTAGTAVARVDITTQDIERTASAVARIEISQSAVPDAARPAAFLRLKALHQEVLADPNSRPKLINLVNEQHGLGIPTDPRLTGTPTPTLTPTQAELFGLLRQRRYNEAIAGFDRRVQELGRADSRDYYGLAVAAKQLRDNKQAVSYANVALKLFEVDGRMSREELIDSQRIAKPTPQPTGMSVWALELNANAKTVITLVLANPCQKMVRIKIKAKLRFGRLLSGDEIEIAPGSNTEIRFEFDTTRRKPGDYQDELGFECLNCSEGDTCFGRKGFSVNVHVKEGQAESTGPTDQTEPQAEQAELFELLRQRHYKEAIAGFERRVKDKRGDSRDYYGLAVAYEQLKLNERAAAYANNALKFFAADRRMSREELIDCERIAKLTRPATPTSTPTPTPTPIPSPRTTGTSVWAVELSANTKTIRDLTLRNPCKTMVRIKIKAKLRFGRLLSRDEIEIAPGGVTNIRFEFDTTRRRPGDYKEELVFECLTCSKGDPCFDLRKRFSFNVHVTEGQPETTGIPDQTDSQDERAQLFKLLGQGHYKEAIAGFERRVKEQRADSRDYYGLAVAYEQLQDLKLAALNANKALSFNQDDRRLSKEEQNVSRRIAERNRQQ